MYILHLPYFAGWKFVLEYPTLQTALKFYEKRSLYFMLRMYNICKGFFEIYRVYK